MPTVTYAGRRSALQTVFCDEYLVKGLIEASSAEFASFVWALQVFEDSRAFTVLE